MTAVKVGHDLAREDAGPPACIAEEIMVNAICEMAEDLLDVADLGRPWLELTESLHEDLDFEFLFDDAMDGMKTDPARQRAMGIWVPDVSDWFSPFNASRVVHPYVEAAPIGARPHDLSRLVSTDEDEAALRDPAIVDDPAPITGLRSISETVEYARAAARVDAAEDLWIPDVASPEASFGRLSELAER